MKRFLNLTQLSLCLTVFLVGGLNLAPTAEAAPPFAVLLTDVNEDYRNPSHRELYGTALKNWTPAARSFVQEGQIYFAYSPESDVTTVQLALNQSPVRIFYVNNGKLDQSQPEFNKLLVRVANRYAAGRRWARQQCAKLEKATLMETLELMYEMTRQPELLTRTLSEADPFQGRTPSGQWNDIQAAQLAGYALAVSTPSCSTNVLSIALHAGGTSVSTETTPAYDNLDPYLNGDMPSLP